MANPFDTTGKSFQRGPGAEFLGARGGLEPEISDTPVDPPDLPDNTPVEGIVRGFSGIGPRYRATGNHISDEIVRHFTDSDALDASDIEVEVKDDAVILRGNVRSDECKRLAEDLACAVAGVDKVNNKLRVHAFDEVTHKYV